MNDNLVVELERRSDPDRPSRDGYTVQLSRFVFFCTDLPQGTTPLFRNRVR